MRRTPFLFLCTTLATFAWACLAPSGVPAQDKGKDERETKDKSAFKALKYRLIGPWAGGRVSRSCGVPGDPLTYYVGASAGGVWKTSDGGNTWKPIFDDQPDSSIGAVAVAASDPNVVYVGGGEANIRGNVAAGHGIYKSLDGGKTWKHVWKQEGQIGQLIVHPKNPDIAFAAVLGKAFGPNPERGVYRTKDGGKTWQQLLKKDPDTGAIDVCFDPSNPNIIYAALWQARRKPWELTSGGPGSGLYVSTDGGDTWKQLNEDGLPEGIWGRVGIAVAPSDSNRIYALIEAEKGGLYRSDDGGEKWSAVNESHYLRQRPWYFSTITVDPKNADVIWASSVKLLKSIDGGKSFKQVKGPHHGDHHDLWIDPNDPRRMIDSNDGGVDISVNGGATWVTPLLPIAQFYHVACDSKVPYHVSGTMQDLGTASGPSNSLSSSGIQIGDWYGVGGGETGFTAPDPKDPNIVYAGEYGGYLSIYDHRTRQARNISIYPFDGSGHGAEDLRVRFQWTAPVLVSPHDHKTVYHAGNVLFKTGDQGKTWKAISPDLTRNDKSKQKWSGGPITGDNTGVEVYCTIFAIAESPKEKGVLWAGSDDGLVHVSRDGGDKWDNVTKNIPGLPEWATVKCIEPSPFDAAVAYLVVDNHRQDDAKPYLFKTADYGKSWKKLSGTLEQDVYLHVVREDPKVRGFLYAGSERGVLFSPDDGVTWKPLKLNLPTANVTDLVIRDSDLVVGTSGRSIWILDDITPLRELRDWLPKAEKDWPAVIFLGDKTQPAVRWRFHGAVYSTEDKNPGDNPPRGAVIHYYLKEKAKEITLDILDSKGEVIRTFSSKEEKEEDELEPDAREPEKVVVLPVKPGVQRVVWDLRHKGNDLIDGVKLDGGNPKVGPLALPGRYKLKLTVDGKVMPEGSVEVLPDPRVKMSLEDYAEQFKFQVALREDIGKLTSTVEKLRSLKKQLVARGDLLKDVAKAKELNEESKKLIDKLDALEEKLHNPKAEVVYDILAQKGGAKLYSQLAMLYDWAGDSDGPITQGMKEVYAEHQKELEKLNGEWRKVVADDVARTNRLAASLELPTVYVPPDPEMQKK
ncbi:MAG TPA: hypothetical protein VE988_28855 [Gemmataceae bacterium]|nr:hypothetical protein [Gemmataceae bacterium]